MTESTSRFPFYLANRPYAPNHDLIVHDKFSGDTIGFAASASPEHINQAIAAAVNAQPAMAATTPDRRAQILHFCAEQFRLRKNHLSNLICQEAGKPIQDAAIEVQRFIDTFRIAAEEATRINGEYLPLEDNERTRGYRGLIKHVPIGPCSFITPFNFPLNLVAHKVAPAIAAGNTFVLKPASLTPLSALMIGEVLSTTDLPLGAFSILPCARDGAHLFSEDPRFNLLSFTGSADIGWELKAKAGKKNVVLELGGNAACIVDADADLDYAVKRITAGAFYQSGQSCISVQRIYVHQSIYAEFKNHLTSYAVKVSAGDPKLASTHIGPIISTQEADRIQRWVQEAIESGARLICGNLRHGNVIDATLLENVPVDAKLNTEEVFGPVAILYAFNQFHEALNQVNQSRYGLQAGIFTNNLSHTLAAWDNLEVGGVIINDVPTWRADSMPYGGVKDSGLGREGIRDAIMHMTEKRLLVINNNAQRL